MTVRSAPGASDRLRALVAEDDRLTRHMLARTLSKWDLEVLEAADGRAALRAIVEEAADLVVTDWEMPGLDGVELCRRVRRDVRDRYVYMIILTSHAEKSRLATALENGADDYLSKPFDPVELRARLEVGRRFVGLDRRWRETKQKLRVANELLERQAMTDPLTGLGNRRAFEEAVARLHARSLRHETPFGLAMIDVDNFKAYNDRYGHPAGDAVLARVAELLRGSLRRGDEIFRYGGEEIVVLLPWCAGACVGVAAERLRRAVHETGVEHEGNPPGVVTVSIGGASYIPGLDAEMTAEEVLERADEALYRAKEGGRNRVEIWKPAGAEETCTTTASTAA